MRAPSGLAGIVHCSVIVSREDVMGEGLLQVAEDNLFLQDLLAFVQHRFEVVREETAEAVRDFHCAFSTFAILHALLAHFSLFRCMCCMQAAIS